MTELIDGVVTFDSFPADADNWTTRVKLAIDRHAGRARLVAEFDAIRLAVAGTVTFLAYRIHSTDCEFLLGQPLGGTTVVNGELTLVFPREGVRLGWCGGGIIPGASDTRGA